MSMKEDLTARLLAASGFTDIVGDSLRWVQRFEPDAYPAATLQTISDPRPRNLRPLDALVHRPARRLRALTKAEAKAIVEAAIAALTVPPR
jgi:hypothetical protein